MDALQCSGRTLAFLGDAVWSLKVRSWLIETGQGNGDRLQRKSIAFVSAKAQSHFYETLHNRGFFNDEEESYYHRGRNSNAGSVPHNTPVAIYRQSTGFEAMIGALYITDAHERIEEIFQETIRIQQEG